MLKSYAQRRCRLLARAEASRLRSHTTSRSQDSLYQEPRFLPEFVGSMPALHRSTICRKI